MTEPTKEELVKQDVRGQSEADEQAVQLQETMGRCFDLQAKVNAMTVTIHAGRVRAEKAEGVVLAMLQANQVKMPAFDNPEQKLGYARHLCGLLASIEEGLSLEHQSTIGFGLIRHLKLFAEGGQCAVDKEGQDNQERNAEDLRKQEGGRLGVLCDSECRENQGNAQEEEVKRNRFPEYPSPKALE